MRTIRTLLKTGVALALILATVSCRTIQYREVQSDFERAVAAETARAESPFVDWYQGVATTLTDDFIARLDAKLRPNAWMLRGLSEWRLGDYAAADASAAQGTRELERQPAAAAHPAASRDAIVLTLLPGLVEDSRLRDRLLELGHAELPPESYQSHFLPQFKAVLNQFREAKEQFAAPTPVAVKHYWNFQVWRVLQNWNITLGRLAVGEPATRDAYAAADGVIADQFVTLTGGTNLVTAIQAAKQAIPADHSYRRLIEFEETQ